MYHSKKRLINPLIGAVFVALLASVLWVTGGAEATAVEISKATRTVPLNNAGEQITLTTDQLAIGQKKFNGSCASCHLDGTSKPNPDVDLGAQRLANAIPPRNSIESMIDYLENPTTYDGLTSIEELHPSLARSDLFPQMRDLTEDDLVAIAGYILVQPKIIGDQWAGGKPRR
ncbi:cytochrome c-550 [Leptolyngbya cf. ectocarpi LEGE 11479]|uniref:Photosystem II extrinsic protein V n=2 Tax=Leptolyngbya ectocarpi TaxID=1202 RepID=A0A929FA69_LEPEC|nr:cytochrome c-550 [Leptolyngbya cf. ectocarpi LEGE 11479]